MIFFSKIKRISTTLVKFILVLHISSFPAQATEYSGSDNSRAENIIPDHSHNTESRRRLDISRKKKPVASRSAKLSQPAATNPSSAESADSSDSSRARPRITISTKHKPTPSRQASVTKAKDIDTATDSSGQAQKAKPRRSRTFGKGIERKKIGEGAAPKKNESNRVFRLPSSAASSPIAVAIDQGSNTTTITTDAPKLEAKEIAINKENLEISIANGQDIAQLNQAPIILGKKKIEPIITESAKPKTTAKPRRKRTFGIGIERKRFTSAPEQEPSTTRVFRLPTAPKPKTVEITPGNNTTKIANEIPQLATKKIERDTSRIEPIISSGSSTIPASPPPILNYKKITIDTTAHQKEIGVGLDTTLLTTITPQLNGKLIAKDLSIGTPSILAGSDSSSLGDAPLLGSKKITADTTAPQKEIGIGLDTTLPTTITPQLNGKLIAKDLSIGTPLILAGSDSSSLGDAPLLGSKKITADTTAHQKEIGIGLDTTLPTTITPQLNGKLVAKDLSLSAPSILAGQDSAKLETPLTLDIRVIKSDTTPIPSKINTGLNSTAFQTPPQLPKKSIIPNNVISNPIIISGKDTIKSVEPSIVLDSRKITTNQTIQQLNTKSGSNSITIAPAPTLTPKKIEANTTASSVTITPGSNQASLTSPAPTLTPKRVASDTTASTVTIKPGSNLTSLTSPAPTLTPKKIAADTAASNVTITPGSNLTSLTNPAPTLTPKRVAADTAASNVTITPGNDSTSDTNPAPVLVTRRIAADTTASNVTIAEGNDSTSDTNPAPVLVTRRVTADTTITAASSTNSTSTSSVSHNYQNDSEKESIIITEDNDKDIISITFGRDGVYKDDRVPATGVKNSVKLAAEHYVKNVGSYAMDSIDAITGIIANRLDGLFKPSAIAVAAGDNPNILEKGIWLKIFGSKTIQEGHKQDNARFENKQQGFVLGADIDFKGEVTGGIAFSINDSNTDFFSDINNYQESKLYSGILYGEFSIWNDFAINTQLKYGHSFIKHSILAESPIKGETRGSIFGASLEGVYKFVSNRTQITPLTRVSYTSYDIYDFMEKNKQGNIRIHIPNKKASMMSVFGSLSFKRNFPFKTLLIEPEFHFGAERVINISHSTDVISIITDSVQLVSAKYVHPTKMRYNFGGNLYFVSRRGLRFGLGGDYMYGKNFRSQAMFANILVNF